jgi:hypothetical protein
MNNRTFVKEAVKTCLATGAISAAITAGMVAGGLALVGAVIQKINSKKS